jgi:hypothetical protein
MGDGQFEIIPKVVESFIPNIFVIFYCMNSIEDIPKRVDALPQELQRQILDYIEFIISKYQTPTDLSDEAKEFLDHRLQKMKDNPEENLEWNEARKEIHQRLNWK